MGLQTEGTIKKDILLVVVKDYDRFSLTDCPNTLNESSDLVLPIRIVIDGFGYLWYYNIIDVDLTDT
jgi:hypothetical protein